MSIGIISAWRLRSSVVARPLGGHCPSPFLYQSILGSRFINTNEETKLPFSLAITDTKEDKQDRSEVYYILIHKLSHTAVTNHMSLFLVYIANNFPSDFLWRRQNLSMNAFSTPNHILSLYRSENLGQLSFEDFLLFIELD